MLGSELAWIIIGVGASLLLMGVRLWAPKAAARRMQERGTLVGPAIKQSYEQQVMQRSETQLRDVTTRRVHDDMLEEARRLRIQSRTGDPEDRLDIIGKAISRVDEALEARPGSYEATRLAAELHLDRGRLMDNAAAVAPLERAAQLFAEASAHRLGVIDNYIGRGWSYLLMTRVDPEWSATYAVKAAAGFADGFAKVKNNVWLMRGWGLAVDRFARAPEPTSIQVAELEDAYKAALRLHRGGKHDLPEWYSGVRRAVEPVWIDVPPF